MLVVVHCYRRDGSNNLFVGSCVWTINDYSYQRIVCG